MNIESKNPKQDNWFKYIAAWEQSGKPQRQYCLENDLSAVQFGYWRKRYLEVHHKSHATHDKLINITKPSIMNQSGLNDIKIKSHTGNALYLPASLPLPQLLPILKFLGFGHD